MKNKFDWVIFKLNPNAFLERLYNLLELDYTEETNYKVNKIVLDRQYSIVITKEYGGWALVAYKNDLPIWKTQGENTNPLDQLYLELKQELYPHYGFYPFI